MATHSSVLAWRIPGTGESGGLPSMGSHRVGHNWSDLAAAVHWRKRKLDLSGLTGPCPWCNVDPRGLNTPVLYWPSWRFHEWQTQMKSVLWLSAQILSLWMEHILRNRKNSHICTLIHIMRTAVMRWAEKKSKVSLHCKQQWKRYRIFCGIISETERGTLLIPLSPPVWPQASIEHRRLWGWQQLPQFYQGQPLLQLQIELWVLLERISTLAALVGSYWSQSWMCMCRCVSLSQTAEKTESYLLSPGRQQATSILLTLRDINSSSHCSSAYRNLIISLFHRTRGHHTDRMC